MWPPFRQTGIPQACIYTGHTHCINREEKTTSHTLKPCITTATWRCHKHFSQWKCSFHLKAALPLVKRLATASDRSSSKGPRVVIMPTYLSLASPYVAVMTTYVTASDDKVGIITTLGFQWKYLSVFFVCDLTLFSQTGWSSHINVKETPNKSEKNPATEYCNLAGHWCPGLRVNSFTL